MFAHHHIRQNVILFHTALYNTALHDDVIQWKHFGEFPSQRPVTRSFDVFFDLGLNKRLSKQSRRWWFETSSRSSWRRCNGLHNNEKEPIDLALVLQKTLGSTLIRHRSSDAKMSDRCLNINMLAVKQTVELSAIWDVTERTCISYHYGMVWDNITCLCPSRVNLISPPSQCSPCTRRMYLGPLDCKVLLPSCTRARANSKSQSRGCRPSGWTHCSLMPGALWYQNRQIGLISIITWYVWFHSVNVSIA